MLRKATLNACLFFCAQGYRPEADGKQELTMIPQGAVVRGKNAEHGGASLLQDASSSSVVGKSNKRKDDPDESDEEKAEEKSLPKGTAKSTNATKAELEKMKCAGKGDGWECLWIDGNGNDTPHGHKCKVGCLKHESHHPSQQEVSCDDGKYEPDPECAENVQCEAKGGGWKCKGVKEGESLNAGHKCEVECADGGDKIPFHKSVTCGHDGKMSPMAGCKELTHCNPKSAEEGTTGWVCQGKEDSSGGGGLDPVKSGEKCNVKCDDPGYVPVEQEVLCTNGKYKKEPTCAAPGAGQKKEEEAPAPAPAADESTPAEKPKSATCNVFPSLGIFAASAMLVPELRR